MSVGLAQYGGTLTTADEANTLRVALGADGGVWLDGSSTDEQALYTKLQSALADAPQRPLLLMSDEAVPVQRLVRVMDIASLSGARHVRLVPWRHATPLPGEAAHGV